MIHKVNFRFIFCSKCKSLLSKNAKKCNKCLDIFCDSCIKNTQCSNCKLGKLQDISINSFLGMGYLLFYCNESIKCTEEYTFEEKQQNHLHENQENINCNICKINEIKNKNKQILSSSSNFRENNILLPV